MIHFLAWKKGIKSLYYCRSKSIQRTGYVGINEAGPNFEDIKPEVKSQPEK